LPPLRLLLRHTAPDRSISHLLRYGGDEGSRPNRVEGSLLQISHDGATRRNTATRLAEDLSARNVAQRLAYEFNRSIGHHGHGLLSCPL
jgi:hypothetical protein